MKIQDIFFIAVLLLLFFKPRQGVFVQMGIILLVCAMPLFALWIFYTAQKFVMYAAFLFLIEILFSMYSIHKEKTL